MTDPDRQRALAALDLRDPPAEAEFDDLVRLAALACDMPIALISLIDGGRQWLKAEYGLGRREPPLAGSIVAVMIGQRDLVVIEDTNADTRTSADPLLTGDPQIRFYAGMPLVTSDGVALGTLSLIDTKPNRLTAAQAFALTTLARQVVMQVELRRRLTDRRQEARLHAAILESAVDYGIISLDLDGLVTTWNEGAERVLGWSAEAMTGQPAHLFFTEEDVAAGVPRREMDAALLHGRGTDERWHRRQDGSRFWANGEMMPLKGDDGVTHGFVKILRDRTRQHLAEAALKRQSDVLQTVTDYVGQAVFQMDPAGRVTFANPAAERIFGWRIDEIMGQNLHGLLHHSHPDGTPYPAAECSFIETLRSGTTLRGHEDVFFHKDGSLRHVLATNAPVVTDGQISSAILTITDITSRKRSELRLAGLTELGDRLREGGSIRDIAAVAAAILGRTLGLSRAGYGAVDLRAETVTIVADWRAPGLVPFAGSGHFSDYGSLFETLRRGDTVAITDVALDERTAAASAAWQAAGIGSLVNLPLFEHGAFVAVLYANKAGPYAWSREDVAFVQTVADRTRAAIARVEAEDRQRTLNQELSHRMKNMLAMVQAIAMQTMRNASDIESAKTVLEGRLIALSQSHDLLLGGAMAQTQMRDLVTGAVATHDDAARRFDIDGPVVPIGARASMALSLILHELATNAVKYGALSRAGGRVSIRWTVADVAGGDVTLRWEERGGPPVTPPTRTGFGTRLIGRGLVGHFRGRADLSYPAEGVVCVVTAPASGLQAEDAPRS